MTTPEEVQAALLEADWILYVDEPNNQVWIKPITSSTIQATSHWNARLPNNPDQGWLWTWPDASAKPHKVEGLAAYLRRYNGLAYNVLIRYLP